MSQITENNHHSHCDHPSIDSNSGEKRAKILTIRSHSGLSGDMMLAGLLRLSETGEEEIDRLLEGIMPELRGSVALSQVERGHIAGWHAHVRLPEEHMHRTCSDILGIIEGSVLSEEGKNLSVQTFQILARAEGAVHGVDPKDVHFHEVGALDSILDICLSCELYARIAPDVFVVSPLPVCDGVVVCAHGQLPVPAPAVLHLLEGLSVRSFEGEGETVTPTAAALLHAFSASFGAWPCMRVEKTALVFGSREFPNLPNGASFALGQAS
ncbi:MAG: LarC family nickel insertion protein [Desulfovibrio sp.]|nr:LarC family nickel insertion protein [Desulfovibrio sp.]